MPRGWWSTRPRKRNKAGDDRPISDHLRFSCPHSRVSPAFAFSRLRSPLPPPSLNPAAALRRRPTPRPYRRPILRRRRAISSRARRPTNIVIAAVALLRRASPAPRPHPASSQPKENARGPRPRAFICSGYPVRLRRRKHVPRSPGCYAVFTSSAIAAPTVLVSPLPPRSRVRGPPSTREAAIARSIASAACG